MREPQRNCFVKDGQARFGARAVGERGYAGLPVVSTPPANGVLLVAIVAHYRDVSQYINADILLCENTCEVFAT